ESEHELGRGGLAAARFADHAERAAAVDGEGNAVDGADHAAAAPQQAATCREMLGEAGGLHDGGHATLLLMVGARASAPARASHPRPARPAPRGTSGRASPRRRATAL